MSLGSPHSRSSKSVFRSDSCVPAQSRICAVRICLPSAQVVRMQMETEEVPLVGISSPRWDSLQSINAGTPIVPTKICSNADLHRNT